MYSAAAAKGLPACVGAVVLGSFIMCFMARFSCVWSRRRRAQSCRRCLESGNTLLRVRSIERSLDLLLRLFGRCQALLRVAAILDRYAGSFGWLRMGRQLGLRFLTCALPQFLERDVKHRDQN